MMGGPKPRDPIFVYREQAKNPAEYRRLKEKANAEGREIEIESPEDWRRRMLADQQHPAEDGDQTG